jgi:hypothetical protein
MIVLDESYCEKTYRLFLCVLIHTANGSLLLTIDFLSFTLHEQVIFFRYKKSSSVHKTPKRVTCCLLLYRGTALFFMQNISYLYKKLHFTLHLSFCKVLNLKYKYL